MQRARWLLAKKNNPKNLLFCFLVLLIFRLAHYVTNGQEINISACCTSHFLKSFCYYYTNNNYTMYLTKAKVSHQSHNWGCCSKH